MNIGKGVLTVGPDQTIWLTVIFGETPEFLRNFSEPIFNFFGVIRTSEKLKNPLSYC